MIIIFCRRKDLPAQITLLGTPKYIFSSIEMSSVVTAACYFSPGPCIGSRLIVTAVWYLEVDGLLLFWNYTSSLLISAFSPAVLAGN
mmetsp:Transcript_11373/g.22613  ORF Transcript_11373/g.22613 Transcript_11373/m.22613 type:complete len:87 (+) Transcript_11373:360-620(+)